ncbi:MAG: o-succinylbenzoate synthase [Cyanophyceae cyanobacterium]
MGYHCHFRPYQRRFRQPLQTSHGVWEMREGIILRLSDENGQVGWGEIAPLPWFGSETLAEALEFCQRLESNIRDVQVPNSLPACQFGFESAVEEVSQTETPKQRFSSITYSWLLPTGKAALAAWQFPWKQGGRTFKWKMGVQEIDEELAVFKQLADALPAGAKLRLDANGGLSLKEAQQWLQVLDRSDCVEFVEQPLAPSQFDTMMELHADFATPIALDESVANVQQLERCYQQGWRGIFVVKAAIAGSPQRLRQVCRQYSIDAVFSSVFETEVGRTAALKLAAELAHPHRAVGFGVQQWFEEAN